MKELRGNERPDEIRREIEATTTALRAKVQALESKVTSRYEETKDNITHRVDVLRENANPVTQIRKAPMASLGGSVVLGVILGRGLGRGGEPSAAPRSGRGRDERRLSSERRRAAHDPSDSHSWYRAQSKSFPEASASEFGSSLSESSVPSHQSTTRQTRGNFAGPALRSRASHSAVGILSGIGLAVLSELIRRAAPAIKSKAVKWADDGRRGRSGAAASPAVLSQDSGLPSGITAH